MRDAIGARVHTAFASDTRVVIMQHCSVFFIFIHGSRRAGRYARWAFAVIAGASIMEAACVGILTNLEIGNVPELHSYRQIVLVFACHNACLAP